MPVPTPHPPKSENATLRARAEALHLHGLLTHWSEVATQPWLAPMLDWEEQQRARRSLERRLSAAHRGSAFYPCARRALARAPTGLDCMT